MVFENENCGHLVGNSVACPLHSVLLEVASGHAGEKYSQRSLSLGVVQHSKEFQVLLFKAVIDMVSKNMRELRGVYQKQRIETHTIRGRIDFSASSKYIAVGMPKFVCLTNVFGVQSRHYSALMTAF